LPTAENFCGSVCNLTLTTSNGLTTTASVKPQNRPANTKLCAVVCFEPNENKFLYCSNVKNFVALFGVSTIIGGKIPNR
jgi:hypothetical protein